MTQGSDTGSKQADAWRVDRVFRDNHRLWSQSPAIIAPDRITTYEHLELSSNRLALKLAEAGVGPRDIVALASRNLGQFACGALAIMKVGAAYLSIDMRYPLTRAHGILQSSAPKLLLADEHPYLLVDEEFPFLSDGFDREPLSANDYPKMDELNVAADDPAYLCYTSGTTGEAKGVLIKHTGIAGLVSHPEFDLFHEGARVASCSTFAFDAITFEVWGALLNGACLIETPRSALLSPPELACFFKDCRIDGTFLTTSLFNAVATRQPDAFGGMQCLVIGGEAADPASVARVFDSGRSPARLVNGYGPTEATTFATCHSISRTDLETGVIPIGRPIAGRRAYVVTRDGLVTTPGAEGELCIGGDAVALGYIKDPALTRIKFIADPFGDREADRIYRTGDLCRILPDGAIQFLGRTDDQVKVKGYRVELSGVAALLMDIAGVEEAVVLTRAGPFGSRELAAFVRGAEQLSSTELYLAAMSKMPDYMVPASFTWVDALPLKLNGKLDATALLSLQLPADEDEGVLSPADKTDELVAALWRKNARRQDFDLDTPFESVGDSLATIRLMIDVEEAFGRTLSVSDSVSTMTVRSMTAALADGARVGRSEPPQMFLISQPWNMVKYTDAVGLALSGGAAWTQLQISPSANLPASYGSLSEMAAALERQLLQANPVGPYMLAGHSFGGILAYEMARRLEARGKAVSRLILVDSFMARIRSPADRLLNRLVRFGLWMCTDPGHVWRRALELFTSRKQPPRFDEHSDVAMIFDRCVAALGSYEPGPLAVPTVLLRCSRYRKITDRPRFQVFRVYRPWARLVRDGLEQHTIECTHMDAMDDAVILAQAGARMRAR